MQKKKKKRKRRKKNVYNGILQQQQQQQPPITRFSLPPPTCNPTQNLNLYLHTHVYLYIYLFIIFLVQNVGLQMVENLAEVIEHGTRDQQADALVSYY